MSYLLEVLGRGLFRELAAAFEGLVRDDGLAATKVLEERLAASPGLAEHHRNFGLRLLQDAQAARARDSFDEALRLDPSDGLSRIGLACTLDAIGLTRLAIEQLETALDHDADHGPVLFALGFCREKLGEIQEAVDVYYRAVRVLPSLRPVHERLAAIHLKLDNVSAALAHQEQVCWNAPDDLSASLRLANLYLRAERFEDAIQRFQFAIAIDPDHWEARDDLVAACINAGKFDKAIEAIQDLIQLRPDCADHHLRLGDLYSKTGRDNQSLKSYHSAVSLNPDYLEAFIKLGTAYLRGGRSMDAVEAFSRAIEINDRIVTAYVGVGVCAQALGRFDEAASHFDMAAAIEPNGTLLFSELARLQIKLSAARQQEDYLDPQKIAAHPHTVQRTVKELIQEQIDRMRAAVRERPTHPDLHYRLGLLLRRQGRLSEAIESFRAATELNPNYAKAFVRLALALHEGGDWNAAIEAAERALRISPEAIELHYQLGLMYADQHAYAAALERFEHVLERRPDRADCLAHVAFALENMGLADRAARAWRTLCEISPRAPDSDSVALSQSM